MSDEGVDKFLRSVSMYCKTYSNRIDFDDDSECSAGKEQMVNKQEVDPR